jgi:hypothetical protein
MSKKPRKKPEFIEIVSGRRVLRTRKPKRLKELLDDPPLLVSVKDAMALVGYKRSKLFSMLADGTLKRVKSGKSTRVTMESIKAFVEGK